MNFKMKLKRFWRNFAIENLILYVVITLGALWAVEYILGLINPAYEYLFLFYLGFNRSAILAGQIWRIITFMFTISSPSPIFVIFSLYFYYLIGTALERTWGSEKFTKYFLAGTLLLNAAGFISGYADPEYFYLSMFCAFAALYPNEEFLLFFILPVKVKYLAYIDLAFMAFDFIRGGFSTRMSIIAALVLLAIFFGKNIWSRINAKIRYKKFKDSFNHRND